MQMLCEIEALWVDRNVENRRENNEKRLEKWWSQITQNSVICGKNSDVGLKNCG